jgi:hypothetical protein
LKYLLLIFLRNGDEQYITKLKERFAKQSLSLKTPYWRRTPVSRVPTTIAFNYISKSYSRKIMGSKLKNLANKAQDPYWRRTPEDQCIQVSSIHYSRKIMGRKFVCFRSAWKQVMQLSQWFMHAWKKWNQGALHVPFPPTLINYYLCCPFKKWAGKAYKFLLNYLNWFGEFLFLFLFSLFQ